MSAIATPMPSAPASTITPPPVGPKPWRWTVEQYYELGARGFFAGKRVELLRGEIVEMSPISVAHANTVGLVTDALALIFAIGYHLNVQQPFSILGTAPGSEPQPDVAVVAGSRRGATGHPAQAALLVEVADSTLFFDTTTKAKLYATAGAPEYWVLDLTNRLLLVFRNPQPLPAGLGATTYQTQLTLNASDTVSPLAAPGATIAVAALLP